MAIIQISSIQQRSGNLVDLPQLAEAQFGWANDAKRLFIGADSPNPIENVEVLTSYSQVSFSQITGADDNNLKLTDTADGQILAIETIASTNYIVNRGGISPTSPGGLITLGYSDNVKLGGGSTGYVLETDGLGNLSWTNKGTVVAYISDITNASPGVVTTTRENFFVDSVKVTITNVEGMTQLNGNTYYVDILTSNTFALYDDPALTIPVNTTSFGTYTGNGRAVCYLGPTATAAYGSNTTIQFNDAGVLNGSALFTFNKVSKLVTVAATAAIETLNVTGNVISDLLPSPNVTHDLGSSTQRWKDLWLSGTTIYLGAQDISSNIDHTIFSNIVIANNYVTGNFRHGNISNSNANLYSLEVSGNTILNNLSVGNINVSNITANYVTINRDLQANTANFDNAVNVFGNLTSANANLGNTVSANYYNIWVDLQGNTATFSNTVDVVGNLTSGNANLGNYVTANFYNIDKDLYVARDANIIGNLVVGNTIYGNLVGNILIQGNIVVPSSINNTEILYNDNGSVSGDTKLTFNKAPAELRMIGNTISGNFFANTNSNTETLTVRNDSYFGNDITVANLTTSNTLYVSNLATINNAIVSLANIGNLGVTSNTYTGNLVVANVANITTAGITNANIVDLGITNAYISNTFVETANIGNLGVTSNTYTGNLVVRDMANINIANITTANIITAGVDQAYIITANITTGNISQANIGNLGVRSNIHTGNIRVADVANINIANITTANIDTVGIRQAYITTANITTGNISQANIGNLGVSSNIHTGNIRVADVANINIAIIANATISNINIDQANIGNLGVSSNIYTGNIDVAILANINNANIKLANIITGNIAQANIGNLGVSSNIHTGNIRVADVANINSAIVTTANITTGNIAQANVGNLGVRSNIHTGNIRVADVANINSAIITTANITTGNIAQANVGNLGVRSNIHTGNLNVIDVANIAKLGVSGKVFTTDTITATGNIDAPWFIGNVIGNVSGTLKAPGSTTEALFNDGGNIGASSDFTFNKSSKVLTVNGDIISTGTFKGGSADLGSNNFVTTGNISSGNISGLFTNKATSNINLSSSSSPKFGNIYISVSGVTDTVIFTNKTNGSENVIIANGNIKADYFIGNVVGNINGNINSNNITTNYLTVSSVGNIATLGVSSTANIATVGIGQAYVGVANITTANVTSLTVTSSTWSTGNLRVDYTANIGNLGVGNTIFAIGNITAPWFIGNVEGNVSGKLIAPGQNTEIIFNDSMIANAVTGFTFDKASGLLTSTSVTVNTGTLTTRTITTGAATTTGTITGDWSLTGKFQATYADLAEYYEADKPYEPGTVLQFGGDKEVTIAEDGTNKVAGVVSTDPAYVMNMKCPGQYVVALALQGRVPVKVRGVIHKGDMLIAAGNGYARPSNNPYMGTVIGKALENFTDIEGIIEVAVGRL